MTTDRSEYFGTDAQRALLARGRALFDIVRGDVRYSYYGRTVGLMSPADGGLPALRNLLTLQGSAHFAAVSTNEVSALADEARASGFSVTRYVHWSGSESAKETARRIISTTPLPDGIELERLSDRTPDAVTNDFARLAIDCGVLPPVRSVLEGRERSGLCWIARNKAGQVVSCAAGAAFADPAHPVYGDRAWWGMLATRPDCRGARLSLILGAHALIGVLEKTGLKSVFTGVEAGNRSSEAVCARMGLKAQSVETLSLADPRLLPGGRMTK